MAAPDPLGHALRSFQTAPPRRFHSLHAPKVSTQPSSCSPALPPAALRLFAGTRPRSLASYAKEPALSEFAHPCLQNSASRWRSRKHASLCFLPASRTVTAMHCSHFCPPTLKAPLPACALFGIIFIVQDTLLNRVGSGRHHLFQRGKAGEISINRYFLFMRLVSVTVDGLSCLLPLTANVPRRWKPTRTFHAPG